MSEKKKVTILTAKDCDISYYCGSGAGGQARNKVHSAVQIIHRESGAIGRSSESRSQLENKKKAFVRMTETPKFKFWLNKKLYEIQQGETIEATVEKEMAPENLVVEYLKNGKWVAESEII